MLNIRTSLSKYLFSKLMVILKTMKILVTWLRKRRRILCCNMSRASPIAFFVTNLIAMNANDSLSICFACPLNISTTECTRCTGQTTTLEDFRVCWRYITCTYKARRAVFLHVVYILLVHLVIPAFVICFSCRCIQSSDALGLFPEISPLSSGWTSPARSMWGKAKHYHLRGHQMRGTRWHLLQACLRRATVCRHKTTVNSSDRALVTPVQVYLCFMRNRNS